MNPISIPQHPQHYPTQLLPHRLEEYVVDGQAPTWNRHAAKLLTGQQVLDTVKVVQAKLGLANIDPRYYVGTVAHEAGCENELDTEVGTLSCPTGFQSAGAYQIGSEEAHHYGSDLISMLDFNKATEVMVRMSEDHRHWLRQFAKIPDSAPDPAYIDTKGVVWPGGNLRAYAAIVHNHGLNFGRITIMRYGMDFAAYIKRNPNDNIVAHSYAIDCITGGHTWPVGTP